MDPTIQKLLYRHQLRVRDELAKVVPDVRDLDVASFFEQYSDAGEVGFRDRGCSGVVIMLPGPKEAAQRAHLHVEQRYRSTSPHDLTFYRYEICWCTDVVLPAPANDYLRDSMLSIRRGVRFDHHPRVQGADHPKYHWHPNGCSELRLATCEMSALKVAILAALLFERSRISQIEDAQVTKAHEELREGISGLPE